MQLSIISPECLRVSRLRAWSYLEDTLTEQRWAETVQLVRHARVKVLADSR